MHKFLISVVSASLLSVPIAAAPPDFAKSNAALTALQKALAAQPGSLAGLSERDFATVPLTRGVEAAARDAIWKAHAEIIRQERTQEVADRVLKDGKLVMPFFFKTFGKAPEGGHSLWISMHGGGGAPKRVNDQQYENQKRLYSLDEGIYLAPRAATDSWNLWHEAHIDRLFGRLIEDLIALQDVNPDRVYILGYSAGGDGIYQLAPRMADRWAAAAMMAGHPNGVSLLSVRNVPFALQVGGNDSAYDRNKIARNYAEQLDAMRKDDPKGYEHFVKIHEGKGHWMNLEDKAALPWMAKFNRNPIPERVVWKQTGVAHDRSYWLAVPPGTATLDALVIADREGQTVKIRTTEKISKLIVRFDDRMLDLDKPITVESGGRVLFSGSLPRTMATILKTLNGRGDPKLIYCSETEVDLTSSK